MPGISPSRGEIGRHRRLREPPPLQERAVRQSCQSPPLRGEMSGRTEGAPRSAIKGSAPS
ncbi:MAG: hypothetical protein EOQ33_15230 [Mesorhizobium sp.]|nr:MAG: hypothetical protein EOQ33_15230 [Mesorhizobium sp.]